MADAVVIGKGPAGISSSLYILRAGFSVDIIGKDNGALSKADKIENYYGFTQPVSGNDIIEAGIAQAKRLGANIITDEVVGFNFEKQIVVDTKYNTYKGDALIIATGSSRSVPANIKGMKEFEGKGISFCAVCDAFFYKGKNIAVIGNSDYALHEVKELLPIVNTVSILTNGNSVETEFPDNLIVDTRKINQIVGDDKVNGIVFEDGNTLPVDGVFIAVGSAGSADFARKLGLKLDGTHIITDENQFTGNPGIFAAGDCTGGLMQIAVAVGKGAVAGTSAVKYLRSLKK